MLLQTPSSIVPCRGLRTGRLGKALTLACLIALGAMACDKVPLTAPAGTEITLVSSTNVLPINGSTNLTAVLIEMDGGAGTPVHNGTLVTFTTSLGRIEPVEARTVNGKATVALIADGRSGTATVTAFSGSATQTLDLKIGAAAAERVSVVATPASVPFNGGTATIVARVEDVSGNPLTGVPVTFTTSAGTLSSQSALTNEGGFATTFLSTNVEATVTASSGAKNSTAKVSVRARSTIELTVPSTSVVAGAATAFTVKPGSVPLTNVVVDFGDGSTPQELGAISASTVVQHFYTSDGIFVVEARGTDPDGGAAVASGSVAVTPLTFSATASPSNGPVGTVFVFNVTDLPANVPIDRYIWNFGDGQPVPTASKSITHAFQSPGTKTVTVTVVPLHGGSKSATLQVVVTAVF
ncbi:MAG TPA: Ig-like domain-containing protein [Vicinamibacterales bacterium]|nr:Ig-like domain-containing protein [Vicinamibacterales bacterium]